MVEVKDTLDNVIATYEYNGLNQRIKKTVGGVLTKSCYNENWQEVESVTGSLMTSCVFASTTFAITNRNVSGSLGTEKRLSLGEPVSALTAS
ncbi:hypothetical protein FACS1894170_04470 [Planctomycetales bacterium]|nr:hypothetical protein FACS1894170_04470 [Planctomycetales bacterium]